MTTNNASNNKASLWSNSPAVSDVDLGGTYGLLYTDHVTFAAGGPVVTLQCNVSGPSPTLLSFTDGVNFGVLYDTYFNRPGTYTPYPSGSGTQLVPNQSYIATNSGDDERTLLFMPTTIPVGAFIEVAGQNPYGWAVELQAGQQVFFGDQSGTAGGVVISNLPFDAVKLVCITADTEFMVVSSVGTLILT